MANVKISQLPTSTTLTGTEVIPIVQSNVTVQTTAQDIANLAAGTSGVPNSWTGSSASQFAGTASFATTASYVLGGGGGSTSGLLTTASFNTYTSSNASQFAGTASFATSASRAVSASFATSASQAVSSSFATTASYVLGQLLALTGSSLYSTNTSNVNPDESVYIGSGSGEGTLSGYAVMIGNEAGYGFGNNAGAVLIGYRAGKGASGNGVNGAIAIGGNAALTATGNIGGAIYIGNGAGFLATGGYGTVNLGMTAGQQASNAYRSVFIGQEAGFLEAGATYNIMIGYQAGKVASAGLAAGSNNIVIGNSIALPAGQTNSINLGGAIFATDIYNNPNTTFSGSVQTAKVGIATLNPNYTLDVSGSGNFTNNLTVTGSVTINSILKLQRRTTTPTSPEEGMIIASGSAGASVLYYYNGSTWNALF